MDYDFAPLLTNQQKRAYKQHEQKMNRIRNQASLETYYLDVLNNKDLFDREYYIAQLKKKGFKFDNDVEYTQDSNMNLKVAE